MARVKGITIPKPAESTEKVPDETAPVILKQILAELTAIREVIGRK